MIAFTSGFLWTERKERMGCWQIPNVQEWPSGQEFRYADTGLLFFVGLSFMHISHNIKSLNCTNG
jgi:hypothetical protein